ncbi:MAG: hypothetical protein KGZ25_09820 [Planctomycetes bacterium]|nr:hypothetical protein [Planctomycetota bacterium]
MAKGGPLLGQPIYQGLSGLDFSAAPAGLEFRTRFSCRRWDRREALRDSLHTSESPNPGYH